MKKRTMSLLLTLCLVIGMVTLSGTTVFAADSAVFTVDGGTDGTDYTYDASTKTLTILGGVLTVGMTGTERGSISITGDSTVTLDGTLLEYLDVQANATINLRGASTDCNKGAITIAAGKTVNFHTETSSRLFAMYAPVFSVGSDATVNFSGTEKLTIETWNLSNNEVITSSGNMVFHSGEYEINDNNHDYMNSISGGSVTVNGGILHLQSPCSSATAFNAGIVSVENKSTYTVYGSQTLPAELETIADGQSLVVSHNAALTIPDGKTLTNNGSVTVKCGGSIVGAVSGTDVVVENHSYDAGTCTVCGDNLMDDCAFMVTGAYGTDYTYADGVLTVIGSAVEISNKNPAQSTTDRILIGNGAAAIILNGVNIDASTGPAIRVDSTDDITIDLRSTNIAKTSYGAGVEKKSTDNALTITSTDGSGTLLAVGNDYGAGIGGSHGVTAKNITISGGTIEASGGGAGIGGGSYGGAENIYITGGTVTAHGGRQAAGIGSGTGSGQGSVSAKNIIISGGNVTATNESTTGAQVIGACKGSSSQNVVIYPGTTGVFYTKNSADGTETKVEDATNISSLAGTKYFSCRFVPLVSVTLPSEQIGYTITCPVSTVEYNEELTLTFALAEGYSKTENFRVLINGKEVALANDNCTVNATENLIVTVEGVADVTAPTAEVKVKDNSWKEFINSITFESFFNDSQDVSIIGADSGSGLDKVYYYVSNTALSLEQAMAITDWTEGGSLCISDEKKYVIYAKATDKAGNYTIISSDGIELDHTMPIISGVEEGKTYYTSQKFRVEESNPASITIDGNEVMEFVITGNVDKTYVIVASDRAGNINTYNITMRPIASLAALIDGITVNNVKSTDKTAVENVKTSVTAADITYATNDEKAELKAITDNCDKLLAKIAEVSTATSPGSADDVKDITPENVKLENKDELIEAKKDLEAALKDHANNLTKEEQNAIQDKIVDIDEALEVIKNVEDVQSKIDALPNAGEVKKSDKETIAAAQKAYDALTDYEKTLVDKTKLDKACEAYGNLSSDKPAHPQTGDNSNIILWTALLFISGSGVVSAAVLGKKRRANR